MGHAARRNPIAAAAKLAGASGAELEGLQRMKELAAQIPDDATWYRILADCQPGYRDEVARALRPHLRFIPGEPPDPFARAGALPDVTITVTPEPVVVLTDGD